MSYTKVTKNAPAGYCVCIVVLHRHLVPQMLAVFGVAGHVHVCILWDMYA